MKGNMSNIILANTASDYSREFRKQLVSAELFPRNGVSSAVGKYAEFSREDLYYVPDTALASSKAKAVEVDQSHVRQDFACVPYAIKEAVANSDIEKAAGPFPRVIRGTVERLTGKLELAQEKRVAKLLTDLTGDNVTTLTADATGTGQGKTNKWAHTDGKPGGKPIKLIAEKLDAMTIRGNTIVIPRSVWNTLQFHKDLADKLPTTAYQTLTPAALAVIFGVDRVLIANGAIKSTANGKIDSIWGNNVVLAHVDMTGDPDAPTAGRTLINEYAAGSDQGWITRVWQDPEIGLSGGTYYQVGHEVDELIISKSLIHVFKDVV